MSMNSTAVHVGRHLKVITAAIAFSLASLLAAGLLVSLLPETYTFAVLIGWVAAVVIVTLALRAHLPSR